MTDQSIDARLSRRSFVGAALAAAAASVAGPAVRPRLARGASSAPARPNILVVIVDQLRYPQWFPAQAELDALLPNLARLRDGAVSFAGHYTASNMCTPSRGALLTGLYPHQTGCLLTNQSELITGFPTWGTFLRQFDYETTWWGKWHLSSSCDLDPYGFDGGTCPSPNGAPGQGLTADPKIADQFATWFADAGGDGPWCTTVSFVNPHDIAWWPLWTGVIPGEHNLPSRFNAPAPNFETPEQLLARGKPLLQRSMQICEALACGPPPYEGEAGRIAWTRILDVYLRLQQYVDAQIGRVLDTLESRPDVAENTVVLFTSDHGEYGGSHGLHGKGGAAYEEALHVPFYVKDPRGVLTAHPGVPRPQLTSSVDLIGLLLTIASGAQDWRNDSAFAHLAERLDLSAICADPQAPGRPWIAHVTDENALALAPVDAGQDPPRHVAAIRTPTAKFATYSYWTTGTIDVEAGGQETELYNYSTPGGVYEIDNTSGESDLQSGLSELLASAMADEVRAPLPAALVAAQQAGIAQYLQLSPTE